MAVKVKHAVTNVELIVPNHYIGHPVLGIDLIVIDEAEAAPKKETKSSKEQPAPQDIIENKE